MYEELVEYLGVRARRDEAMSRHTALRVGGPADVLVDLESPEELKYILEFARRNSLPLHVIGRGANVLVSDAGVRGVVVRLSGAFRGIDFAKDAVSVTAGAGLPLGILVDETCSREVNSFCWAAGVPGTVGGAVVCNAGCWGHTIAEFVERLGVMTLAGCEQELSKDEIAFAYRSASLPMKGAVVTDVSFRLSPVDAGGLALNELRASYLARKRESQPLDVPSAGSVFKNPPGHAAGALIDQAGCKGLRVGGAVVSPKHANFIVNEGGATAGDVWGLIETVRERVRTRSGVALELELRTLE